MKFKANEWQLDSKLKSDIVIRNFRNSDKAAIAPMFESFQDTLASMDPLKSLVRKEVLKKAGYGEGYLKKTLKEASINSGIFLVAQRSTSVIGFAVGLIREPSKIDLIEDVSPRTVGEVTELYVAPRYQGSGIGKRLMAAVESYFEQNKCTDSIVHVFWPNKSALKFYGKIGYEARNIQLLKKITKA